MEKQLEKAKAILNKSFCLMQWQAEDAKRNGREVMTAEDIGFLLSLEVSRKVRTVLASEEEHADYDTFEMVSSAKAVGLQGIRLVERRLPAKEHKRLLAEGCFVNYAWAGSTAIDEIYFSEESFVANEILDLQSSFGVFAGFHARGFV